MNRDAPQLEALTERIRALERAGPSSSPSSASSAGPGPGAGAARLATGWAAIDAVLGGGLAAGVHEWLVDEAEDRSCAGEARAGAGRARSRPSLRSARALGGDLAPVMVWMHLVRQAVCDARGTGDWSVWVGQRCFGYPHGPVCGGAGAAMERALFIDVEEPAQRLWAIDLAARCPAVAMVLADGSDLDMAATRRLQLAAEHGSMRIMLARPIRERKTLSAATTRWLVRPTVTAAHQPRWELTLCRCKGVQRGRQATGTEVQHQWTLEGTRSREQGVVVVSLEPGDRSATQAARPPKQRQRA